MDTTKLCKIILYSISWFYFYPKITEMFRQICHTPAGRGHGAVSQSADI